LTRVFDPTQWDFFDQKEKNWNIRDFGWKFSKPRGGWPGSNRVKNFDLDLSLSWIQAGTHHCLFVFLRRHTRGGERLDHWFNFVETQCQKLFWGVRFWALSFVTYILILHDYSMTLQENGTVQNTSSNILQVKWHEK